MRQAFVERRGGFVAQFVAQFFIFVPEPSKL